MKGKQLLTGFITTQPHLCVFLPRFPYLRLSQAVQVGDVEHTTHGSSVYTTCPSLLQTQVVQDLTEAGILGDGGEELLKIVSMKFVTELCYCCVTLLSRGSLTWTPALSPVPRLEGQVRM